jgi:hypothetical protein
MTKFSKQLLSALFFSIGVIIFANLAFAAPYWAEKPIQCASPKEVFDRLDRDGLVPLFSSTGNAKVENNIYTKMYAMLYNAENGKWAFIEFFDNETTCVIVVGEGVDFNVQGKEES